MLQKIEAYKQTYRGRDLKQYALYPPPPQSLITGSWGIKMIQNGYLRYEVFYARSYTKWKGHCKCQQVHRKEGNEMIKE